MIMTLKMWLEEMSKRRASIKQVSDDLAIAFGTHFVRGEVLGCGHYWDTTYICFKVFYQGHERMTEVSWRTDARFPGGWAISDGGPVSEPYDVYPKSLGDVRLSDSKLRGEDGTTVEIEVLATRGSSYTVEIFFPRQ